MDIRFNKYVINPLSMLGSVGGFALGDLLSYKPGVQSLVYGDTIDYYNELYNGGQGNREFRLSTTAPVGMPIADRWIELIVPSGTTLQGANTPGGVYVIECPVMKLNQKKIINKTQVFGYEGTIKEFICMGDWEIDFTFYIVGQRRMEIDNFRLYDFLDLYKGKSYIEVNSPLLNNVFDINRVVIEEIGSITEHETYNNIMVVNLSMISDSDYIPFTKLTTNNNG